MAEKAANYQYVTNCVHRLQPVRPARKWARNYCERGRGVQQAVMRHRRIRMLNPKPVLTSFNSLIISEMEAQKRLLNSGGISLTL